MFYAKEEEEDKKEEEFAGEEKDLDRAGGFMLQVFRIDLFSILSFSFLMCYNIFRFPRATKI